MNKKIFISYSWGDSDHQEWVVNLATRLMQDSVDVELDRWSLKDGHDTYSFMEEMVKTNDIFRVLIISDKKYTERANDREGGVGTETQIISPNIYAKEKQEKFIPIVKERDSDGKPFLPIYLKSRKYIDFSRDEIFEDSYEELLRNILETPSLPKPKLGTEPPTYITESIINLSETNNKLRTIENQLKKNTSVSFKELNTFVELYLNNLWNLDVQHTPSDLVSYGDLLINTLKSYRPLKDDFIRFIDILSAHFVNDSASILIDFFESAPIFNQSKEGHGNYSAIRSDICEIIFHELFIYTIAICLKNRNYELAADLLHSKYYKKDEHRYGEEPEIFSFLYNYHVHLEDYTRQVFNKINGFGDYVIANLSDKLKKEDLILADMLCYFISYMDFISLPHYGWFPLTYLYGRKEEMNFFQKMSSKKHFERTKVLFNVSAKHELEEKLNSSKENSKERLRYDWRSKSIPFIHELIDPDRIAIYR